MLSSRRRAGFEPIHDCNDVSAEFEWPFPDETFYIPARRPGPASKSPSRSTLSSGTCS